MVSNDLPAKQARLANTLASALRSEGVEVLDQQGGALTDDHRGGTYATANVTLSADGAVTLALLLGGQPIGEQNPGHALRSVLHQRHIGATVNHDPVSGNVGLAQCTEGVGEALLRAITVGEDETTV